MEYEKYATDNLLKLAGKLEDIDMSPSEYSFLNGLVSYYKPKKVLEVGVASGGSSAVILNAMSTYDCGILHSIDFVAHYYANPNKAVGYVMPERFPQLMQKWKLYTGGTAARFMDEIGGGIDFCLLDTYHCNPGEFLDFLLVLPYLRKNAVIAIHDIALHTMLTPIHNGGGHWLDYASTCGVLLSAIRGAGEKMVPSVSEHPFFRNIGAVIIADDIMDDIWSYMNLLTLKWKNWKAYEDNEWAVIRSHLARHYAEKHVVHFDEIIAYSRHRLQWDQERHHR